MRDGVAAMQLGSEFDAFLFAPIERDETGVMLSVVSALARLDIDPWREAAELTRMTKSAANQRLTSLIATIPDASATRSLPGTIANRLIELLPRSDTSAIGKLLGTKATPKDTDITRVLVINLILMAGILCAQWAVASLMPPANADATEAPKSGTAQPPTTTPPSRGALTIG